MKLLVRILNTFVAFCCILIIILIFWFLYLVFTRDFSGVGAARYIASEVVRLWGAFWGRCVSIFS